MAVVQEYRIVDAERGIVLVDNMEAGKFLLYVGLRFCIESWSFFVISNIPKEGSSSLQQTV